MSNNQFWENLAGLYHKTTNGNPMQSPQPLEEGGYVGGEEFSQSNWDKPAEQPQSWRSSPAAPTPAAGPEPGSSSSSSSPWWMNAAKGFAGQVVPAAGQAATGMLINKMFPGQPAKTRLLDTRQPEMQRGAVMASDNLSNLQKNPNSFGLPGDPNDVNTPAGQRQYQIRKNVRSASAAAGGLETGGGAQRETDAINKAIGDTYQTTQNSGFQNLASMSPQLQPQSSWNMIPGRENPWGKVLMEALGPGIGSGIEAAMGNTTEEKRKKASWGV